LPMERAGTEDHALLRCVVSSTPDETRIQLVGEADISVRELLRDRLTTAVESGSSTVRVEMGALEFMDGSALDCFLDAARRAEERGVSFSLCCARPAARRLMQVFDAEPLLLPEDPAVEGRG
jgi:anti-anti-sigma factor